MNDFFNQEIPKNVPALHVKPWFKLMKLIFVIDNQICFNIFSNGHFFKYRATTQYSPLGTFLVISEKSEKTKSSTYMRLKAIKAK